VLPGAVLRELRAGRPASAAAVVVALAWTTAGYLRGKLPGATSGVRLPAAEVAATGSPGVDAPTEVLTAVLPPVTAPRTRGV
jgi:hypothetical protein